MLVQVAYGDSPAIIARKYGVTMGALIGANPQKPTTVVAGVRTWRDLRAGETVSVPVGGYVGDPQTVAVEALMNAGSPCSQANVAMVCLAQGAMGVSADGKWGSGTAAAAQKLVPSAPGGCSPRPAWWAPAGQSNCPSALPALPPAPAPSPTPAPPLQLPVIPGLTTCPAGQFLNPLTGACEAFALPPIPSPIPAAPPPAPLPVTPVSVTCPAGTVLNPLTGNCDAIPLPPPSIGCQPGQVWNPLTSQCETPVVSCPPGTALNPLTGQCQAIPPPPPPPPAPAPSPTPAPGPTVGACWNADGTPTWSCSPSTYDAWVSAHPGSRGSTQPIVVAPTKPGLSTGTIVAGAVGAVALVGIIAAASMSGGKKSSSRRRR